MVLVRVLSPLSTGRSLLLDYTFAALGKTSRTLLGAVPQPGLIKSSKLLYLIMLGTHGLGISGDMI